MTKLKDNEYKCACCGGIFEYEDEKTWSKEDKDKEAMELFGVENASNNPNMEVVCDICFKEMSKFYGWGK